MELAEDGRVLTLGRGRRRALLGLLLLRANETVTQDLLLDALWGESPPPTAPTALHGHVSRLRRLIGSDRIETSPAGYALRVGPGELDADRFRRLLREDRYDEALAIWRGPALSDLAFESFAQTEIARLEELRLVALERRFERELDGGRHAALVGELAAALGEHPLRERFTAQLMLALYRAGRQAEALETFRVTRARLVEELGLEPREELTRLQRQILEHDPALDHARPQTRLPAPVSPFVGRERELGRLRALLDRRGARLLTLTGPGGTGKTRLALEIARRIEAEFADGARFVPLAAVSDGELVARAIARALEVRHGPGQPVADALKAFVRERDLLLVLDNFEHLLDAGPLVSELLTAAPRLAVLSTSRTRLDLYGEHEYAVPPLTEAESVSLFVQRARAARAEFAPTGDEPAICARLDGLPLAIELAAARIRTLTTAEILTRLDRRLELLTGGPRDVPARQRTLRGAIRWSYDLMPDRERRTFARLGVFAGGWPGPAAKSVCDDDLAPGALAEHHLIRVDGGRGWMLETIRELALERLAAAGEEREIRLRHATWILGMAEAGGPNRRGSDRAAWLERLDRDRDNVRAALAWCAEEGDAETGLRIAGALLPYWTAHAQHAEGRRSIAALLARSGGEPSAGSARALTVAAFLAGVDSDYEACIPLCRQSLRQLDDGDAWHRAVCQNLLGTAARQGGDLAEAARRYAQALALATPREFWWPTALALANLGQLAAMQGRPRESLEHHERSVAIADAGGDGWMSAICRFNVGRAARQVGDAARAAALFGDALQAFAQVGNTWGVAVCLDGFAGLAAERGDFVRAARLYGAEEAARQRAGLAPWATIAPEHEAGVEAASGALGAAAWAQAREQGGALSQQQAIEEALASPALRE